MKIVQIRIKPGFGLVFFCSAPGSAGNKPNNCSVCWPMVTLYYPKKRASTVADPGYFGGNTS